MDYEIIYGQDLIPGALPRDRTWSVVIAPPLRQRLQQRLGSGTRLHPVSDMEQSSLDTWVENVEPADAVLGVGGGVALDAAKYLAWAKGWPLHLAPSVISVDAAFTDTVGVRCSGRVRYVGKVKPAAVLVDEKMILGAPAHINRAGAGDILSIHTALWDWRLAAKRRGEAYNPEIASESALLLQRLSDAAEEIARVTPEGIRTLVDLFTAEVELCDRFGSSRPEEGSEHFWAYNAEYLTGRGYVHGELVALGIKLISALQGNGASRIGRLIDRLDIRWRPEQIGMTAEEVIESLRTAKLYVEQENLPYSVLNERALDPQDARQLVQNVFHGL